MQFIFNSWLENWRYSDECKRMSNDVYYRRFKAIIAELLTTSLIVIAFNPEDEDQVYGYICYKKIEDIFVLHYAYVKFTYRRQKLFHRMLREVTDPAGPMMCSFANKFYDHIRKKIIVTYDPYLR